MKNRIFPQQKLLLTFFQLFYKSILGCKRQGELLDSLKVIVALIFFFLHFYVDHITFMVKIHIYIRFFFFRLSLSISLSLYLSSLTLFSFFRLSSNGGLLIFICCCLCWNMIAYAVISLRTNYTQQQRTNILYAKKQKKIKKKKKKI